MHRILVWLGLRKKTEIANMEEETGEGMEFVVPIASGPETVVFLVGGEVEAGGGEVAGGFGEAEVGFGWCF